MIKQKFKLSEKYKDKKTNEMKNKVVFAYLYRIFDRNTGFKLLEWTNRYINPERNKNLRVLGFLSCEKVDKKKREEMRARFEESEYGEEEEGEESIEECSNYEDDDDHESGSEEEHDGD